MFDYDENEFNEESFNEDEIYSELDSLDNGEERGICVDCGNPNAKLGIDPYSESTGGVYYCNHCAPADLLIL